MELPVLISSDVSTSKHIKPTSSDGMPRNKQNGQYRKSVEQTVCDVNSKIKERKTEENEESLEFWLNPTEPDPTYLEVPHELVEIVISICQQKSVQYPAVIQAVDNYKHILVTGLNVESIHELIAAAVANKFSQFKIFTQNRDGPVLAKQMARDDVPVVEQLSPRAATSAEFLHGKRWRCTKQAILEIFFQARVNNKVQTIPGVYAAAPAHMHLPEDQKREAALPTGNVVDLRERVEKNSTERRFVIKSRQQYFDLHHPPLLHYRHWYVDQSTQGDFCPQRRCNIQNSKLLCPHMCMNDIALLWIDPGVASRIRAGFASLAHESFVVPIKTRECLKKLVNIAQKVCIGNMEGKITSSPIMLPVVTNQQHPVKHGLHLTFALAGGSLHRLEAGDCGSIVSLLRPDGRRAPVAMFVGEFVVKDKEFSNVPIYQAIILDQALRDIEIDYPHHVEDIKSFRPEQGARPTDLR